MIRIEHQHCKVVAKINDPFKRTSRYLYRLWRIGPGLTKAGYYVLT